MPVLEDDPEKINDPDRALAAAVIAEGKEYQESRVRSRKENALKAKGRKKIDDLGFNTSSYQVALRVSHDMTPADQKQFVRDLRFFLKVFNENDFWPQEAAIAAAEKAKRKAERKAKAAAKAGGETPEQQVRRLAADSNPRSDPKRGGAGKAKKAPKKTEMAAGVLHEPGTDGETGDEMIARISREKMAELEQKDGAALLDTTPKAQSEIAKQKLQDAGLA